MLKTFEDDDDDGGEKEQSKLGADPTLSWRGTAETIPFPQCHVEGGAIVGPIGEQSRPQRKKSLMAGTSTF